MCRYGPFHGESAQVERLEIGGNGLGSDAARKDRRPIDAPEEDAGRGVLDRRPGIVEGAAVAHQHRAVAEEDPPRVLGIGRGHVRLDRRHRRHLDRRRRVGR